MRMLNSVLAASLAAVIAGQAQAAVSTKEAAKLGTSLTPVGAEMAANADGSIPAYTGGLTTAPAGFKAGDGMRPDPFADEKPLLVIDGKNVDKYKGLLTATTAELAKRYPTYHINVYPTHRTVALPQAVLDNSVKNATGTQSINGGLSIDNLLPGVPFPIPTSGSEAMWNHLLRVGGNRNVKYDSWNVDSAGVPSLSTTALSFSSYPIYDEMSKPFKSTDVFFQMKLYYTGPARRAGEAIMLKDTANPLEQPRRSWQYLPGQRRVKLAPDLAYDTPNPGTGGAGTYDDVFVFNGALDRFDWKLVGKQEMLVPYNTYKLTYAVDVKQLTTPNHIASDFVRWEKHRVWVVEGTLKSGARHIYQKRRIYLDEDSWIALASDQYDSSGKLYRGSFAFLSQSYDKKIPDVSPFMIYDLVGGSYNINGITGTYGGIKYIEPLSKAQWAPDALAGSGIR
ncbi:MULTISPECIES: DUF1329 domain-containing protein [Pseudomonas]|jgi:hypothetical protein|uniref:DUF1329 domain-containing protein n=1 Tax=Pseudomonas TaxID=286 RepID=UPI00062B0ECE|nr:MULTISPECIES: DUF1329 domain-containing protein [Pseudomonas]KKX60065.1 hypothetical protein PU99_16135 [Pseudomonas putida]NBB64849.1 DUF1329 domain-containing protein [Pseudomonas sp. ODNR1LW]